jgi:hypothetical protein
LYDQMLECIRSLPGVQDATLSGLAPISDWQNASDTSVEGNKPEAGLDMSTKWDAVGPEFFQTMGMRLLLGRTNGAGDTATSPKIAVVNEAMRGILRQRQPDRAPVSSSTKLPSPRTSSPSSA